MKNQATFTLNSSRGRIGACMRMSMRPNRRLRSAVPGLEHQEDPQGILEIALPTQMSVPNGTNGLRIEHAALPERRVRQLFLGPFPQGSTQPSGDRDRESLLGAINQLAINVAIQHLSQEPLSLAITDLQIQWQLCCELDETMIQERHAGLQRYGHGSSVNLYENVVGEVGALV